MEMDGIPHLVRQCISGFDGIVERAVLDSRDDRREEPPTPPNQHRSIARNQPQPQPRQPQQHPLLPRISSVPAVVPNSDVEVNTERADSEEPQAPQQGSTEGDDLTPFKLRFPQFKQVKFKRKAVNRAAQRAFRELMEEDLEGKLQELEVAKQPSTWENERLKRELQKGSTENRILRATSNLPGGSGASPGAREARLMTDPTNRFLAAGATIDALQDDRTRFRVWAGNMGLHETGVSSLEYRLRDASQIRAQVFRLLRDLEALLTDLSAILSRNKIPWDQLPIEPHELDPEDEGTEAGQICQDVNEVVDCLLRLSVPIRRPVPHDRFTHSQDNDTSELELHYQHVVSKFPLLGGTDTAKRLAKALAQRRQYFQHREAHHSKVAHTLDADDTDSPQAQSVITSSTPNVSGKGGTASPQVAAGSRGWSDAGVSQTSCDTSLAEDETLRIPSLLIQAPNGPFKCPFCDMVITANSPISWEEHVYSDLRSYICLAPDCMMPERQFSQRHEWMEHMRQSHLHTYKCPFGCALVFKSTVECEEHFRNEHQSQLNTPEELEALLSVSSKPIDFKSGVPCPLCYKTLDSASLYQEHVCQHQEQLSLFSLLPLQETAGAGGKKDGEDASAEVKEEEVEEEEVKEGEIKEEEVEGEEVKEEKVKEEASEYHGAEPDEKDTRHRGLFDTNDPDYDHNAMQEKYGLDEGAKEESNDFDNFAQLSRRARTAGSNFDDVADKVRSLGTMLGHLDAEAYDRGYVRKGKNQDSALARQLPLMIAECDLTMRQLEILLDEYADKQDSGSCSPKIGSRNHGMLALIQKKLADQMTNIEMFLDTMQVMDRRVGTRSPAPVPPSERSDMWTEVPKDVVERDAIEARKRSKPRVEDVARRKLRGSLSPPQSPPCRTGLGAMVSDGKKGAEDVSNEKNKEPFNLGVLVDTAFAYDSASAVTKQAGATIRHTPLDRALRGMEAYFDSPHRSAPICRSIVNCAAAFSAHGKKLTLVGTDYGVFFSEASDPRGWTLTQSVKKRRVTQVAVLEEFNLCLLIADRSLVPYPLDVVVPASGLPGPVHDSPRWAPRRLANCVAFFATARMKDRMLVFYKKHKNGMHSTFKVLEPVLTKATEERSGLFRTKEGSTESFRDYDEFYLPADCFGLNLFQTYIAVASAKGFELLTLDKKITQSIPRDLTLPAIANIAGRLRDQRPLGMFRLNDQEFLLAYEDCAIYVDKHGEVSRTLIMEYSGKQKRARGATMYGQYLVLFTEDYVEVQNAENGRWRQIIAGKDVRCIDYGYRGPTGVAQQGDGPDWRGTVKLCMSHPEVPGGHIVLEMVLNDGYTEIIDGVG